MRFLRTVFILLLVSFFFIAAVYFYFIHQYPPARFKQLATAFLSQQFGRTVQIHTASFHLLKGFRLENVTISRPFPANKEDFLTVDRVELRYRLKALLHKKIVISKIVIDHPKINLIDADFKNFFAGDSSTSQSSFLNHWLLAVQTLELRRAEMEWRGGSESGNFSFFLSNFLIDLRRFQFSGRDSVFSLRNFTYRIIAGIDHGALRMTYQPHNLQLDSLRVKRIQLSSSGNFVLKSARLPEQPATKIPFAVSLQLQQNRVEIDWFNDEKTAVQLPLPPVDCNFSGLFHPNLTDLQAQLSLHIKNWFFTKFSVGLVRIPYIKAKFFSDSLSLNLGAIFSDLLQAQIPREFLPENTTFRGQISLDSIRIAAEKKNDKWRIEYNWNNRFQGFDFRNRQIQLSNFDGWIRNAGVFVGNEFQKGDISAALALKAIRLLDNGLGKIDLKNWHLSLQAALTRNFVPDSLALRLDADDIFGAVLTSQFNLKSKNVHSLQEMNFDSLKLFARVDIREINLEKIAPNSVTGSADFLAQLQSNFENRALLHTEFKTKDLSVEFDTTEGLELLPDVSLKLSGDVTASAGFAEVRFKSRTFSLNDLITGAFEGNFITKSGESDIYLQKLQIDLPLIEEFLPAYLRDDMTSALWSGRVTVTAEANTWFDEKHRMQLQIIGDLRLKNELFDNPYWYLHLDTLDTYGVFSGDLSGLLLDLEGKISGFQLLETTPVFTGTEFFSTIVFENWRRLSLQSLDVIQPQLNLRIHCTGMTDYFNGAPFYYLSGTVRSNPDSAVQIILNTTFYGDWEAKFAVFSRAVNPAVLELHGWLDADSLSIRNEDKIALYNLNGRLPFDQIYDPESGYFVSQPTSKTAEHRFDLFTVYPDFFQQQNSFFRITADSLVIKDYKVDNIELFMDSQKSSILIPNLSMDLYDGNLVMNALINLNSGAWQDISYRLAGQLSRVNSSILPGVAKEQEEARIGVSFNLLGRGLETTKKIVLSGGLEVTEIGARATENLLNSIDPYGKDPGIRSVKKMIKLGYKPNVISFRVQHGNLYPSVSFAQPWYLPVRIQGGKISISRVPIKFILNIIKTETGS